jgi:hypothetical protein
MSVATESGKRVLDPGSPGQEPENAKEALLSRLLLRAIDAHRSDHREGPTVPELAADLGITPDFGHNDLVARLQRELSLGNVSHYRSRYKLTRAGRALAESEA